MTYDGCRERMWLDKSIDYDHMLICWMCQIRMKVLD